MSRYHKNSECKRNMLHAFIVVDSSTRGIIERCTRCGLKKHFPDNTPNAVYLSYHNRSALQFNDPRFHIEYPHATR